MPKSAPQLHQTSTVWEERDRSLPIKAPLRGRGFRSSRLTIWLVAKAWDDKRWRHRFIAWNWDANGPAKSRKIMQNLLLFAFSDSFDLYTDDHLSQEMHWTKSLALPKASAASSLHWKVSSFKVLRLLYNGSASARAKISCSGSPFRTRCSHTATFSSKIFSWSSTTIGKSLSLWVNFARVILSLNLSGVNGTLPVKPWPWPGSTWSEPSQSIRWLCELCVRSEDQEISPMHQPRSRYSVLFSMRQFKGFDLMLCSLSSQTGMSSWSFFIVDSHTSVGVRCSIIKVMVHSCAYMICMLAIAALKLLSSSENKRSYWNKDVKS